MVNVEYLFNAYWSVLPNNPKWRKVALWMTFILLLIPLGFIGTYAMLVMAYVGLVSLSGTIWLTAQLYEPQTQSEAVVVLAMGFLTTILMHITTVYWAAHLFALRYIKPEDDENRPTTRQMFRWTAGAWTIIATLCLVLLFI